MDLSIAFSGSPLDRAERGRRDHRWLEERLADPASRFLPFWRLQPLVKRGSERALAWARREFFSGLEPEPEPALLGLRDGVAHYAVDVSAASEPDEAFGVADVAGFEELRAAVTQLAPGEASMAAHGRSLVDWHARHRFCAACGGHTRSVQGGACRVCFECQAEHFPRTDPVVIAAVVRGNECLLGRSPGWPAGMFSALAGYVEPGETVEEAVRREVLEECGVRVGRVTYLASQPWPFPSSLMIGCVARAESAELRIDPAELEEARWLSREALRAALAGERRDFGLPPPYSIAHQLVRAWVLHDAGA